jgi:hypothetical protein
MTSELDAWYEKAIASLTVGGKEPEWHHYLTDGDSSYRKVQAKQRPRLI